MSATGILQNPVKKDLQKARSKHNVVSMQSNTGSVGADQRESITPLPPLRVLLWVAKMTGLALTQGR